MLSGSPIGFNLQSRYYDTNTCRFINADGYVSTGQGILGYNMFAYCNNNPVNLVDHGGNVPGMAMVCLSGYGSSSSQQSSISDRLNINGDNPRGDIVVTITNKKDILNVHITDSYRFTNKDTQRGILKAIFSHKDYIKYGGLGEEIMDMILLEWYGHNTLYWGLQYSDEMKYIFNMKIVKKRFGDDALSRAQHLDFGNTKDQYQTIYAYFYWVMGDEVWSGIGQ